MTIYPPEKKILYINLNCVISDFDNKMKVHSANGDNRSVKENGAEVDNYKRRVNTYYNYLEPIQGAIETINKLAPHYNICFVVTKMWKCKQSYEGMRHWIVGHFGESYHNRLIHSNSKIWVYGHYFIDDRNSIISEKFKGEYIHFSSKKFSNWRAIELYLTHSFEIKLTTNYKLKI
ncbi:MAG: 5' nucleotidase, NT5C type [Bacteroidota bacterium]